MSEEMASNPIHLASTGSGRFRGETSTWSRIEKVRRRGALHVVYRPTDASSAPYEYVVVNSERQMHIAAQRQREAERAAAEDAEKTPEQLLQQAGAGRSLEVGGKRLEKAVRK